MKITAYPEDTSPANNDLLLTVDVSSGTNKKVTVTNLINTIADIANLPVNGWFGSNSSVSSVTYNGNRSYSVVTGTDLSSTISAGMRLRTTRTVSAPTQCTSLNGTNQYFSKTSPAGMTFTDDFVVSAWVKLSSYSTSNMEIVSRYNGTSGWEFRLNPSGQLEMLGRNGGASNIRMVTSYQSLPLNKWVHVAAQLDMSAHTATTTTSYVMFDGIDVPAYVSQSGTNPTSLVQAGNLEIGSNRNGIELFPGKIAQAFVSSAKITQQNVRTLISQGITPALITANNIISAYSFNNSINDLNTTNANNLTAQNSAVATNADSPFGGQSDGTISSTLDYGIVQRVSGTTLTVQVAEGNTIPTSGGVSSISYSNFVAPYGFPGQKGKWQLRSSIRTSNNQPGAVTNTWYNIASAQLTVPVGEWVVGYSAYALIAATSGNNAISTTLSTASNAESDLELSATMDAQSSTQIGGCMNPSPKSYSQTTQNPLYLNTTTLATAGSATLYNIGNQQATVIYADNAYL